jgi:UDP-N-acetylmuramyl pentapeptide phosphotransferase/UDP-N-acetylglucosamine-1-phosphate transferase
MMIHENIYNCIIFFVCLLAGSAGALVITKMASKFGLVDRPNDRSSHGSPTPKGGGIGILGAFILSSLILKLPLAFWTPVALLALVSLWGDRYDLSPKIRLPLQFIVTVLLLLPITDHWPLTSVLWFIFFTLFIVATANWYNFMDGINGIAGVTGVVGFGLLALFGFLNNNNHFSVLSICIIFSCLGFLPFNFPKARVFMGDVGSILLGFVFASIVMMLSKSLLDFLCLVSFLFPFYADELITIAIRIKDGESLFSPHRRHLYQLLANEMRIDHWKVTVAYGLTQLVIGVAALFAKQFGVFAVATVLTIFSGAFVLANYLVRLKIIRKTAAAINLPV